MKGSAAYYEGKALALVEGEESGPLTLMARLTPERLGLAQVYATLAQAATVDDLHDLMQASGLPVEIVSGGGS